MADRPNIVVLSKGGAGWLGGRQYTLNLLRALIANRGSSGAFDLSLLVWDTSEITHYAHLRPALYQLLGMEQLCADRSLIDRVRWKLKRVTGGGDYPQLEEALLSFGATFVYPAICRTLASADWISDFQYHHHPDKMSAQEIIDRKAEFGRIVANARHVVLSSADAERDCHSIFPNTMGQTSVLRFRCFAENGWYESEPMETVAKYKLPARFALISNWMLPTKNHLLVLDALAALPADTRKGLHVVCTGDIYDYRNPGYYNHFLQRVHTLGLRENVFHLGVVPKFDQIQLLRASTLYLQPSLFEGWNTGVEEAQLLGKPILLSDIPVHREQNPMCGEFFDPHDASRLGEQLATMFDRDGGPGWNSAEEQAAAERYKALQMSFAQAFLNIVAEQGGGAAQTEGIYGK